MSTNTSHPNRARGEESETKARAYTVRPASFSDILCICFKAVGLLVIAFICFVTLIHRNNLKVNLNGSRDFRFEGKTLDPKTQYRRSHFYTNVQQSKLLMNAGIMGFCAISFSSFFMQLMCFWIAKMWLRHSEREYRAGRLPTPLQMAVMFQIADGGWGGFWGYLTYAKEGKYIGQVTRVVRKMNHRAVTKQPIPQWAVHLPAWLLLTVLLTGTGISICSIMLHTQSKPITVISREVVPKSARSHFGRRLADACKFAGDLRCTNFAETYKTLKDTSTSNKAASYNEYIYLAQANVSSDIDYEASSFGLKTDCNIIKGCAEQWSTKAHTKHRCADYPLFDYMKFEGDFEFLIDNHGNGSSGGSTAMKENPYHIGIRGRLDPRLSPPGSSSTSASGENLLLWCKVTAYNITYSIFNEEISDFKPEHSNGEIGRIFCEPFHGGFANLLMEEDFRAAQTWSGTHAEVCHAWAKLYSTIAISQVVGVMEFDTNHREWERKKLPAAGTELPIGILTTIYVLVAILASIAFLLAALAYYAARNSSKVRELVMKISIEGLVAQLLEQHGTGTGFQIEHIRDIFIEREEQCGMAQQVGAKDEHKDEHKDEPVGERVTIQFKVVDMPNVAESVDV